MHIRERTCEGVRARACVCIMNLVYTWFHSYFHNEIPRESIHSALVLDQFLRWIMDIIKLIYRDCWSLLHSPGIFQPFCTSRKRLIQWNLLISFYYEEWTAAIDTKTAAFPMNSYDSITCFSDLRSIAVHVIGMHVPGPFTETNTTSAFFYKPTVLFSGKSH